MYCPFCQEHETKVIDSRLVNEGTQVRRRRECLRCQERFTTYESAELIMPRIIKRDGSRDPFEVEKLRTGFLKALEKRPVSMEDVETAVRHIVHQLRSSGEQEVSSQFVGELVMQELKSLDPVAYVRFASVYRSFQDVQEFNDEINKLRNDHHE